MRTTLFAVAVALVVSASTRVDAEATKGTPDIKSISALAFGPNGVLFIGDPVSATIYAIETGDASPSGSEAVNLDRVDAKVASMLGTTEKDIRISDVKVNPASGNVYLAVTRGTGAGQPAIVRINRSGKIEAVPMKDVQHSKVTIPNPADAKKARGGASTIITSMSFVDGKLIVAGLSNEDFASTLRSIPYPFKEADKGTGIQIFHGAHGKIETHAPIRTFAPYKVNKEDHLMAAYTCTPLVKIPVDELKPGAKVKGVTIAELGNRNNPLDMIVYQKGGKDYILMANSARGVMKIPTEGFGSAEAITARPKSEKAGVEYETIADLKGVMQLDKLDDSRAIILVQAGDGFNLKTIPLP
jgi:hypothetical protein